MALRIKLFIGLVRPQKIRPPHGSATKDSTPPTPNPAESRSQADRIKEFFMRRGAAEQHGKLLARIEGLVRTPEVFFDENVFLDIPAMTRHPMAPL